MGERAPPPPVIVERGRASRAGEAAAFVWLHGLGADGHDFEAIVPELNLPEDLSVRFVFPHAPVRPVTINGGAQMRAWYDITGREAMGGEDEKGIRSSARLIEDLVAAEKARGIPAERILLGGFSQGGAMSLHAGLRHAERLGGIMVLSAYLPLPAALEAEASPANRETPILQCHGTFDPLLPLRLGETTRRFLVERGYEVDWRTYPMPHAVHPQEIADIGAWTARVLRK